MWSAWLHVVVVHFPVVLTPVGVILVVRAIRSQRVADLKVAYVIILIAAIGAIVAYLTGPTAADWLQQVIKLDQDSVEDHGVWGRAAFTVMVLAGAGSLLALIAYLQEEEPHPAIPWVVTGLSLIGLGLLVWTAHLGGLLRRPELGF